MWGIVGALQTGRTSRPIETASIARMRDTIAHRGPDGAGVWVSPDRRVGLGHCRLAIIDLTETGAQPMSDASGSVWLTYNGEIYNHAELRRGLESLGHRFHSARSRTDVINYAYQ